MSTEESAVEAVREKAGSRSRAKADPDEEVVLNNRFSIFPGRPLPELDTPNATAVMAADSRDRDQRIYALVLRRGHPVRTHLLRSLKRVDSGNVLRVFDGGAVDLPSLGGRHYVLVLERPEGGRLSDMMAERAQRMDSAALIGDILTPVLHGLRAIHEQRISYRSLRPDNLYFVDAGRTRLALGECMSAAAGMEQPASFEPLEQAMAHPWGRGEADQRADFFALGALLVTMLSSRIPGEGRDPVEFMCERLDRGSYVALTDHARFASEIGSLLRGLLNDNNHERWTYNEIIAWIDGRRSVNSAYTARPQAGRGFPFRGKVYFSAPSLAFVMATHWQEALRSASEGKLEAWVARTLGIESAANAVRKVLTAYRAGDISGGADKALAEIVVALDPDGPVRLRGYAVMPDGIGTMLALGYAEADSEARQAVSEIVAEGLPLIAHAQQKARSKQNHTFHADDNELVKMRSFMRDANLGFGAERVLYDLNPEVPCLSPLVADQYVRSLPELMRALDRVAGSSAQSGDPMDRHIAAFITSRLEVAHGGMLRSVIRGDDEVQYRVGVLNLLCLAQEGAKGAVARNLSNWMAQRLSVVIASYNSKSLREWMERELARAAKTGILNDLRTVVDDPGRKERDWKGFEAASLRYRKAERDIAKLESEAERARDRARLLGYQIAALLCYLILLMTLAGLSLDRFV